MEIKSVTKTLYLGLNGKEFDSRDRAIKSIMIDRIADFLYNYGGKYDPDYVAATEALCDVLDIKIVTSIYEAVKDD